MRGADALDKVAVSLCTGAVADIAGICLRGEQPRRQWLRQYRGSTATKR